MNETTPPAPFLTCQAAAIEGRSRRGAVTGKLRVALHLMVWENLPRKVAAEKAGLADSSLRFAFRKPHVMAYYHAELKALRDNLRAKNVHRLDKIADDSKNDMARVASIKTLEQIADQVHGPRIEAHLAGPGSDWMRVSDDGFWRPDVRSPATARPSSCTTRVSCSRRIHSNVRPKPINRHNGTINTWD